MKHYQKPVAEMIELLIDEEIMSDLATMSGPNTTGSMGEGGSDLPWMEP